jgi:hypothetical protein
MALNDLTGIAEVRNDQERRDVEFRAEARSAEVRNNQ